MAGAAALPLECVFACEWSVSERHEKDVRTSPTLQLGKAAASNLFINIFNYSIADQVVEGAGR